MENIHRVTRKPRKCPFCGSKIIATYMYGMPVYSEQLMKKIEEGKTILGGCCISDNDPVYSCFACRTDFYKSFDSDFL